MKLGLILLLGMSGTLFAADEELLLRRKAELLIKRVHVQNMNLIGVDPKTCRPSDKTELLVEQMNNVADGTLSHCLPQIESALKPINDQLKQVESGVLIYPKEKSSTTAPEMAAFKDFSPEGPKDNYVEELTSASSLESTSEDSSPVVSSAPETKDHTGLTEEEKNNVLANYDKEKAEYSDSSDDGLFKKLSKAYIRNLDKVFNKKKKIEE